MVLRVKVGGATATARAVVAVMVAAATVAVETEVAPQGAQAARMVCCHSTRRKGTPMQ